jgi:hypothetical protein
MVRGQNDGHCRKPQEGGGNGCYRKLLEEPHIAGKAEVGLCQLGGKRRRSVRGGRRSARKSARGGRRSVRGGRRSARRKSARGGGNYGCKQPKWGKECL